MNYNSVADVFGGRRLVSIPCSIRRIEADGIPSYSMRRFRAKSTSNIPQRPDVPKRVFEQQARRGVRTRRIAIGTKKMVPLSNIVSSDSNCIHGFL